MIKLVPEEFAKLIDEFEQLQGRFASAGAEDTEPDAVFHRIIHNACDNKPVKWDELDWDLYDNSDNEGDRQMAKEAGPLLTAKAKAIYDGIRKVADSRKSVAALKHYAWRCSS